MADLSLRQYLRTVEQHVQSGRFEEAIAHSRRILEHFPRLAAAYRLLGLALVGQSRWDEASEVFRRLLSATPDDFVAHQQLSLIYEKLKKPQESLWHLERALDLQPNDQQSVGRLRELYSKERGAPLERVPMTTAALAGQYLNNGLTDQAIEVLQAAIQRMPDRVDLKLMLARAQWTSGQHVEAGETAVEVLQTLPYTLAANRILTELWLEVQRPADAQRFLSRVEEVDPYLAMRLATNEAPSADAFKLPELDYQQHIRQALTQQNPDWLENLTDESQSEQPLDLMAELGDDWMNEIEDAEPVTTPNRVTDNLPDLLEVSDTDSLSGLSPELMARIDAMRNVAADSTSVAPLPDLPKKDRATVNPVLTGMLNFDQAQPTFEEEDEEDEADDSWLDELARNDDFTIEASDVNASNDDWIANLERAAGTTGDRVPTGLTGQLGDFDADDAIDDLDAMLNNLENSTPIAPGTPRAVTGLTGLLDGADDELPDFLQQQPEAISEPEPKTSTRPRRPGAADTDVDTDSLDWVQEFDNDMAVRNTSPLNSDMLPASDSDDRYAWMQNTGIEVNDSAPLRMTGALEDDLEGDMPLDEVSTNPHAWMDALGVEYSRTDELLEQQARDALKDTDAEEDEDDSMAWAKGLDLVASSAPTSALPAVDLPIRQPVSEPEPEADPLDWMSDDDESLLAEYEAFESLQGDEDFEDDPYSTAHLNANTSQPADDVSSFGAYSESDQEDDFELAADANEDDASFELPTDFEDDEASFELPADFEDDELTEDELVENADLYAELLDSTGPDEDENFIPDEYRAAALTDDSDIEGQALMQTPWQPSDPDDPDQPSMGDDLEWLSTDSLSDDLGEDEFIADPDADEPITDLDSFFGGPLATEEGAEPVDDASWLNNLDIDENAETPAAEDPSDSEFDWSMGSATDVPATDASWLSDLGTASTESSEDAGFDWNSGFGDEASLTTEEPDWLSSIDDPAAALATDFELEAEGIDDSAAPAEAGWLSDLELEDAADSDAAESDEALIWDPEAEIAEDAEENEMSWLSEASDNVVSDFGALTTEDDNWNNDETEVEPEGESWLADLDLPADEDAAEAEPVGEAWLSDLDLPADEDAEAEPAAEGWLADLDLPADDEDAEAEPAGEGWLSELEAPGDDPIAQPLSTAEAGGWLDNADDTGLDWETLDDAEPSPTAGMTGLLNNIETQRYGTDLLETAETSDEEPSWLETVEADEAEVETPAWMQSLETPEDPVASGIDWSADTFGDEEAVEDDAFAPVSEEEGFAWENPAFAAEQDVDQLAFGEPGEEDFLYGEEDGALDPDALTDPMEEGQSEWLTGIGQATDESWMEADEVEEEQPAWLSDLNADENAIPEPEGEDEDLFGQPDDEEALPVGQEGYFTGTADEDFDFGDENALEDDESLLPVGQEGYFTGTADENFDYSGSDEEQEWLVPDASFTAEDANEQLDWMTDPETPDVPVEPVMIEGLDPEPVGYYSQAQLSDAESVSEAVTDDDLREYDFAEELEATPAANAPDWLNSMVPGLDLDFEAEEEVEETPEPAAAAPAPAPSRKNFDWLETIVNEEASQRVAPVAPTPPPPPPSLPAVPSAPSVGERMRRFIFKDVPSWMRGTPAATVAPVAPAAPIAEPDFDHDFTADMDDDLFDDLDAEFDDFDDGTQNGSK